MFLCKVSPESVVALSNHLLLRWGIDIHHILGYAWSACSKHHMLTAAGLNSIWHSCNVYDIGKSKLCISEHTFTVLMQTTHSTHIAMSACEQILHMPWTEQHRTVVEVDTSCILHVMQDRRHGICQCLPPPPASLTLATISITRLSQWA